MKELPDIFENRAIGIARCNALYDRIENVNDTFAQIHGYAPDELIGISPSKLFTPEAIFELQTHKERAVDSASNMISFETTHFKKDGSTVAVSVDFTLIEDENGAIKEYTAHVYQITEEILLPEPDTLSEKKNNENLIFSSIMDSLHGYGYIYQLKPDGHESFLYLSDSTIEILGFQPKAIIEDISIQRALMYPEELERYQKAKQRSAQKLEAFYAKYRIKHPTRGDIIVESRSSPEAQADGTILWHGITTEITGQKRPVRKASAAPAVPSIKPTNTTLDKEHLPTQGMSNLLVSNILKKLDASERELRTLTANISDALVRFDSGCRFVYANKSFELFMGVKFSQLRGKSPSQVPELIDGPFCEETIQRVIKTGIRESFEHKFLNPDGSFHFGLVDVTPEIGEDNTVKHIQMLTRDITKQKNMEEFLLIINERFTQIFNNSYDAIYLVEVMEGGRFIHRDINNAFVEATGLSRETIINRYVDAFEDEAFKKILIEKYTSCLDAGERTDYTNSYHFPSGEKIYHSNLSPIHDENGHIRFIVGISRDITEQKRIEYALHEIEAKHSLIFKESLTAYGVYSLERKVFIEVNQRFLEQTGYSREEIIGVPNTNIFFDEAEKERYLHELQLSKKIENFEFLYRKKDGSIGISLSNATLIELDGEWCIVGENYDITEKKRQEEQLKQALDFTEGVINTLPDLLFEIDKEGTYLNVWASNKILLTEQRELLLGKNIRDFLPPESVEIAFSAFEEVDREGTSQGKVYRVELPQEGEKWFELSVSKKMPEGTYLVLSRDVTKKRALRLQSELLSGVVSHSNEAVYIMSPSEDLRFTFVNDAACRMTGYSREELLAMTPMELDATPDPERMQELKEEIILNQYALFETVHRRKDGTRFPVEIHAHFILFNGETLGITVVHDITERKAQEAQLLEQNRFLDSLLNAIPVPVFYKDKETRYKGFNKAFEAFYGKKKEELIGKGVFDLFPPEQAQIFFDADTDLFRHGGTQTYETKLRDARGADHDVMFHKALYSDTEGTVIGQIGTILDISERIAQEEALKYKEQELRALADSSPGMMGSFHMREDGSISMPYVSPNISNIFGLQPQDVAEDASSLMVLTYPDDAAQVQNSIAESARTMTIWHEEYRINHPVKGLRWVESNTQPQLHPDGGIIWHGHIHDITERKQMQDELKNREQALNEAQRIAHVGSWDVDVVNDLLTWSDETYRIWEIDKEQFEATFAAFLATVHPKDRESVSKAYNDSLLNRSYYEVEHRLLFPDGRIKYIHERGEPHYDATGKPVRFIGTALDITERKLAEESLIQSEHKLRTLTDNLPDNIARWDLEGRYLYINPTHENTLGIPASEIIGKKIADLAPSHTEVIDAIARIAQTGEESVTVFQPVPDGNGNTGIHEVKMLAEKDAAGKVVSIVALGRDTTERKRMEELLKNREQALNEAQRIAQIGSWKMDMKTGAFTSSDEYLRILEIDPDSFNSLASFFERFMDRVYPGDRAFIEERFTTWQETLESYEAEHRLLMPDGRVKHILQRSETRFDEDGAALDAVGTIHDITERKKMEEALSVREREFRTLAENTPNPIFRYDLEGRRIYVNPVVERFTGLSAADLVGKNASEKRIVVKGDDLKVLECIRKVIETGKPVVEEFLFPAPDGQMLWFENTHVPEFAPDGTIQSVLAIAHDITAVKKQSELTKKLKESEARYQSNSILLQSVLESSPDLITFALDKNYRYIAFNTLHKSVMRSIWGKEIALDMNMLEVISSDSDREVAKQNFDRALLGENFILEEAYGDEHLSRQYWQIFYAPILSETGEITGLTCFNINITERKQIESFLEKREQEFRALSENSPDTIVRFDPECRRTYVNPSFKRMFGLRDEEVLGKPLSETTPILDSMSLAFEEKLREVMQSGRESTLEMPFIDAAGKQGWGHVRLVPEFGEDGKVVSALSIGRDITEIKRIEESIAIREREFRALVEQTPDTIARYDKECIRLYANPAFAALTGLSVQELQGVKPTNYNDSEQARMYEAKIKEVFETGDEREIEYNWPDKKGIMITSHIRIVPERDANGNFSTVLATGRDITRLKEQEARLNEAQKMAKVGSWELEFPGLQLYWSDEIYRIFEIAPDENEASYDHFLNAIHPEDRDLVDTAYNQSLQDKTEYAVTHRLLMPDGRIKYVNETGKTLYRPDGTPLRSIGTVQDITKEKNVELQIKHLAHHDVLTGLPNRLLIEDRAEQSLTRAKYTQTQLALLYLDLDEFKAINDSLGHSIGDLLLKSVAHRLKECLTEGDTISRQGGDEFLILLCDKKDKAEIITLVETILYAFEKPFQLHNQTLFTSVSIGVALYPDHSDSFESLLKKADVAMYDAKASGKNNYSFFTHEMIHQIEGQLELQNDLKNALNNSELTLHYQPQIDLAQNSITGVEALLRWQHPTKGMIPPMSFIPQAESNGMIIPIGEWVLKEACRQAAQWHKMGMKINVAVNISALQFKRGNLESVVKEALSLSALPPQFLELELTESILINDVEKVLETVQRFKDMGIQLSIDDFGTGYSSLSYLKRFAVDKLKIDQSFIRGILKDEEDANIVKTIIQMAKNLNLKSIAEGVEDQEVLDLVYGYGCDEVQGYHFAKPMQADGFEEYYSQYTKSNKK